MAEARFHDLVRDLQLRRAVERSIHIIGEAAGRVSSTFKSQHPDIPWGRIVAQRNVIAHEYGDLKLDRLWEVATEGVPSLLRALEQILPPEDPVVPTQLPE